MSEIKQEFDAIITQLTGPGAPFEVVGGGAEALYYKNAPANLVEAMGQARQHGDKEFLVYQGEIEVRCPFLTINFSPFNSFYPNF